MARPGLSGTRVREQRMLKGVKQADLARHAGISASYLNLIEHNRRRIGGKLLADIARVLEVDPTILSQGAEASLIATLRDAAQTVRGAVANPERAEELAGRFPGWAQLVKSQHARITDLEQRVAALSDRVSHDPFLSETLHEILSTVTAIHSTATLLSEPEAMNANWQRRFTENLSTDSQRLADAGTALAQYLDTDATKLVEVYAPQDELNQKLAETGLHFEALEQSGASVDSVVDRVFANLSAPAKVLGREYLRRYSSDADVLPFHTLRDLVLRHGLDPGAVAAATGHSMSLVFRRLASVPYEMAKADVGLITCDGTGVLFHKLAPPGFSTPRVGAACSLWPIFSALLQPLVPLQRKIQAQARVSDAEVPGTSPVFEAYAISEPVGTPSFNTPPTYEATMLLVRQTGVDDATSAMQVGAACRVCPLTGCSARREPSVLA